MAGRPAAHRLAAYTREALAARLPDRGAPEEEVRLGKAQRAPSREVAEQAGSLPVDTPRGAVAARPRLLSPGRLWRRNRDILNRLGELPGRIFRSYS